MQCHLSVQFDSQDLVWVAVIADFCPLLEMIDVHPLRHGGAHHHDETAGKQTLHDIDVWSLCWRTTDSRQTGSEGHITLTLASRNAAINTFMSNLFYTVMMRYFSLETQKTVLTP